MQPLIRKLLWTSRYMSSHKCRIIIKIFIAKKSCYCLSVWMFESRKLTNRVYKLHERALKLINQDYQSTFNNLLEKKNSTTMLFRITYRRYKSLNQEMDYHQIFWEKCFVRPKKITNYEKRLNLIVSNFVSVYLEMLYCIVTQFCDPK